MNAMTMRSYTVDAGTHSVLMQLEPHRRSALDAILARFDKHCRGLLGGAASGTIEGPIKAVSAIAKSIRLEMDEKSRESGKIIATVNFANGIVWRRGSLRIPGVDLPKTQMLSIKGKRIGDIVAGAPFPEFIIRNAIIDRSANGNKLRIRCTGDEQVEINR